MSEMNKIIRINGANTFRYFDLVKTNATRIRTEADSDLVCQAGASWMEINATLKEKGIPLFFPV